MKSDANKLSQKQPKAARNSDLVQRMLARNAVQLAAQKRVLAAAETDWERVLAEIKLRQLEMDGKILHGELPAESQFLFNQDHARRMTIRWDLGGWRKMKLK